MLRGVVSPPTGDGGQGGSAQDTPWGGADTSGLGWLAAPRMEGSLKGCFQGPCVGKFFCGALGQRGEST